MNIVHSVPGKFNHMHLSLVQMVLDLSTLLILVHFTGLIFSPFYMFFIFQMVIGSLILPGRIVYVIGSLVITIFGVLIFFQHYAIINSHMIAGLYLGELPHTIWYDITFILMFSGMMLITVLLTNTIAIRLYQRERQLWQTLGELNDTEKAKQKYIIGVVHEIKTPIAAVQSILDVIINGFMGPVSDEILIKLNRSRKRTIEAVTLINNVLHLSKIKLLNITKMDEIDISEILSRIIDKQSDNALSKNIEIQLDDSRKVNRKLQGDEVLFELALSNVIGNAVKYNLTNGIVKIIITEHGNNILLNIADNGIGIPEEDRQKIFNQFFRSSNIKGQQIDGSGLGLSVVNEVVTRYFGRIEVKSPSTIGTSSRPGTSFIITLPYSESDIKKPSVRKRPVRIHGGI